MMIKNWSQTCLAILLLLCFKTVSGQFVEMETYPMEGYNYLPYFPEKLMTQQPERELKHNQLSQPFAWKTTRPDTIIIHKKIIIGQMDSTRMYCFTQRDHPAADLLLAVKNNDDWVILKTILFRHLTYDATEFRIVGLGKEKIPHLEAIVFRQKNVLGQYGRRVSSQWKRSKSISLINLNSLNRVLSNVYVGYEYIYTVKNYTDEVKHSEIQSANLWYDFKINYKKGKIKIKVLENRLDTLTQTGEAIPLLTDSKANQNAPLFQTGVYKFDGKGFVLKR